MKQRFSNKPLSYSGIIRNYHAIPVYFSFKEQLIEKLYEHIPEHLVPTAINYVAYTTHHLAKNKLNPPNRKALLFNVAMTLLGHVDEQKHTTITLAYTIMELINNAKQQASRSSTTI